MRKRIQTTAGWIHISLILAIIFPFLYIFLATDQTMAGIHLYLKSLIILFPVVAADFAADRCRHLLSYLLVSALTFAATGAAAHVLAGSFRGSAIFWGYMLSVLGETLFVITGRLKARLRKIADQEAAKGADPDFSPFSDILKEPSFLVLLYFGAFYILALNFNSPSVCNIALFSVIVYVPVTALYQYVDKIEQYLSLNRRTCNLPSRRIYVVGGGILAIYLLILMLLALPSLFTVPHRQYRDLREWAANMKIDYMPFIPEFEPEPAKEDVLASLLAEYDAPPSPPWWMEYIFQIIAAFIFLFFAAALLKKIYTVFQDFRNSIDENGDIVEELQDTAENVRKIKKTTGRRKFSEKERIRKEYRKMIRRHRKDRPAIYESPAEMEDKAGLAGSEEMAALHTQYELARYGQGCQKK